MGGRACCGTCSIAHDTLQISFKMRTTATDIFNMGLLLGLATLLVWSF